MIAASRLFAAFYLSEQGDVLSMVSYQVVRLVIIVDKVLLVARRTPCFSSTKTKDRQFTGKCDCAATVSITSFLVLALRERGETTAYRSEVVDIP